MSNWITVANSTVHFGKGKKYTVLYIHWPSLVVIVFFAVKNEDAVDNENEKAVENASNDEEEKSALW